MEKRESELDAKARRIQSKIDAKLAKKTTKKSSTNAAVKRKESESEKSLWRQTVREGASHLLNEIGEKPHPPPHI